MNISEQKLFLDTLVYSLSLKDPYTSSHSLEVSDIATYIATSLNFPDNTKECITMASKVHDIGKIGIPLEILVKPGRLTDEEYAVIRTHTRIGYDIISKIPLDYPIADIVKQHHERLNGSGYPHALTDNQLLLESKIIAVADVTHALISHRPYRPSKGIEYTINELNKQKGIGLHGDAVEVAIHYLINQHIS